MESKEIENHRDGAEIYHGAAICKQKLDELLYKFRLPKTVVPLKKLFELGFNPNTGFVWLKQEKPSKYKRKGFGVGSYATEITMFIEDGRMRKMTGVKGKEMMIWFTLSDISVNHQTHPNKITFSTAMGLSNSFPVTRFDVEAEEVN